MVEFYGCTEASPHVGGFSCAASQRPGEEITTHLMEDVQIWEVIHAESKAPLPDGQRGLTVCTNLNSEASPQLRFLVGDYTVLDRTRCGCGRTHARAVGSFACRADDLINLRGIKMFPIQIEQAVRAVEGTGDEFEIVLVTNADGLDIMTVRLEHESHQTPDEVIDRVAAEVRTRCEVQVTFAPTNDPRPVQHTRGVELVPGAPIDPNRRQCFA
jgi:phenylacetate-CoA ligase